MFDGNADQRLLTMRSIPVLLLMVIALAVGVCSFIRHGPTSDSRFIDTVTGSMQGIGQVIPAGSRIGVRRFVNFTMLFPINHYALASQNISLFEDGHFDTVLVITASSAPDSLLKEAVAGKRVLWQNQDSMYRYYITCSF